MLHFSDKPEILRYKVSRLRAWLKLCFFASSTFVVAVMAPALG